ncbi:MAG TPA: DUF1707 and FHA domain-containing protein [Streptosporangiaceae bacterium]|nr:DUF1707 and FHA domain-containing protein [Streptosporangiaceae bacterium]
MRASSNRLVTGHDVDGLRASDAERDHAIGELRDQFAEGRLSQDTFLVRMDAALRAKERAELTELFTDLPENEQRGIGRAIRRRLVSLRQRLTPRGYPRYPAVPPLRPVPPLPPAPSGWQAVVPVASTAASAEPKPLCLPRHEDRRFTIGRAPSCDFTVADLSVSRWHARLHKEEDSWLLSDLGSTNGTRLNGWRVTQSVQVQAGDEISFGTVTFVVTDRPVIKDKAPVVTDKPEPVA